MIGDERASMTDDTINARSTATPYVTASVHEIAVLDRNPANHR
jgi:hypothetical protein